MGRHWRYSHHRSRRLYLNRPGEVNSKGRPRYGQIAGLLAFTIMSIILVLLAGGPAWLLLAVWIGWAVSLETVVRKG